MTHATPTPSSAANGPKTARPVNALKGRLQAAADKSCSHRALIFSALAEGQSRIEGLLESEDVLATAGAVAALGAKVEQDGPGAWRVIGQGRWTSPALPLDLGNSGTGVRLLMGAASRFDLKAEFVGDDSLSSRPMARVLDPLARMGVKSQASDGGRLPVTLRGSNTLNSIDYTPPVASAQVKSAILLAGLGAQGETIVREPRATRDHTEIMAPVYGADMSVEREGAGLIARVRGGKTLTPANVSIPGDPSSAAFPLAAALVTSDSEVTITGVMTNPARFGLYQVLKMMGADIGMTSAGERCGEQLVDIRVKSGALKGVEVPAEIAPSMIDEYPILSVIAAFADGVTVMKGLAELRAKESDRLAASAALLESNGVKIELGEDSLSVHGCGKGGVPGGGRVKTHHDHRLAMSALIMGCGAQAPVGVDDVSMIATSYPDFFDHMAALGAEISAG
ncbi:3-phosphoshikimate 1-carboxyvinyltransferase [Oceanicaulis sp.]|uniref:3-phosphoshikimate 1-carboxyvinyltransferase n=1 Tax=Oceanicaulis sp. TaxID=1924941 RepID=UPI003D2C9F48